VARFLAIDWDQNQLHVVSASVSGSTVKIHRAAVWHEQQSPNPATAEELGKLLRERLKEAGIAPAPVLACLGRDRVILKDIRHPPVPEEEEAGVIRFQAVKELTDAPNEVVIDYVPAGLSGNGLERHALVLIARKELVGAYQTLCQAAGLKLAALTPRQFGLAACYRKVAGTTPLTPRPEPADGAVAVVTVSERWAEFCILRGENLLLARSLAVGSGLAGEIRRNLAVYAGQAAQHPVRALYVAGGSPELRTKLGDLLVDLPIHPLDPFPGGTADVPDGSRGSFAGVAGLLYCRAESKQLPINFVQPRQPRVKKDLNLRPVLLCAALLIVLLVGGALYRQSAFAAANAQLRELEAERSDWDKQLLKVREDSKQLKALDDWDNVVVLDEIYDLTQRIPDVNALRVTNITAEPMARTAKSRFSAKIVLKGTLVEGRDSRKPVDQLVAEFTKDRRYNPEAPKVNGNQFTLTVLIERRPPGDYSLQLKVPTRPAPPAPRGGQDGQPFAED
jgi:Tfp pilus assembly PilM family ATPase